MNRKGFLNIYLFFLLIVIELKINWFSYTITTKESNPQRKLRTEDAVILHI
jgi:hypothetical protein